MGDAANAGKINGEPVTMDQFAKQLNNRTEGYKNQTQDFALERVTTKQLADQTWNDLKRDILLGSEFEKLGIKATTAEIFEEIVRNPNIQGAAMFRNEATQQFEANRLTQYLANMRDQASTGDPQAIDFYQQWLDFEEAITEQILNDKYNAAVSKGLYTPTVIAKESYRRNSQNVAAQYVHLPYSDVADSEVTVSDAEIKKYYNANKNKFKQEASRDIEFVDFFIEPSFEDEKAVIADLEGLVEDRVSINPMTNELDTVVGFQNTDNDSLFVAMNGDLPFQDRFLNKDEFSETLDTILWDAPVGTIYGPYLEGGYFVVDKVNKVISIPDSVKASHILIAFQGAERAGQQVTRDQREAFVLADSLYKAIKEDPSLFSEINIQYSDDQVSKMDGGNLNWFQDGQMAEGFSKYCFRNKSGDIGFVPTNFGFHIIRIDDQKGATKAVRLATLARRLTPSENTIKDVNRDAANFASAVRNEGEPFSVTAESKGYNPRPVTGLEIFDENILGLGNSRNIVKWAYDEKSLVGDMNIFDVNNQVVAVVQLTRINEEGPAPLAFVRDEIEAILIKEKKAEILKGKLRDNLASATDVASLATATGKTMGVSNMTFSSNNFPGIGNEPKAAGTLHGLPLGILSSPVAGETGVFVLAVSSRDEFADKGNYDEDKELANGAVRNTVQTRLFPALEKQVKITDRRHVFY
jgi:peptidylprolyl isomerase/peptidyl-prolyl cis-trans isomerase D